MNRSDFQRLSGIRIREAGLLLENRYYCGAYYLAGYAVECALKACITKQIDRHDFPDKTLVVKSYTHDLGTLLGVAGLQRQLEEDMQNNQDLADNWSTVKDWSEKSRYRADISEIRARALYSAVVARKGKGVLLWLKSRW